jgi:hypothetical protein
VIPRKNATLGLNCIRLQRFPNGINGGFVVDTREEIERRMDELAKGIRKIRGAQIELSPRPFASNNLAGADLT